VCRKRRTAEQGVPHPRAIRRLLPLATLLLLTQCVRVAVDPIKVEPIHVTMDVNIRVQMRRQQEGLEAVGAALDRRDFGKAAARAAEFVTVPERRWAGLADKTLRDNKEFKRLAAQLSVKTRQLQKATAHRDPDASWAALREVGTTCSACHMRFKRP